MWTSPVLQQVSQQAACTLGAQMQLLMALAVTGSKSFKTLSSRTRITAFSRDILLGNRLQLQNALGPLSSYFLFILYYSVCTTWIKHSRTFMNEYTYIWHACSNIFYDEKCLETSVLDLLQRYLPTSALLWLFDSEINWHIF